MSLAKVVVSMYVKDMEICNPEIKEFMLIGLKR